MCGKLCQLPGGPVTLRQYRARDVASRMNVGDWRRSPRSATWLAVGSFTSIAILVWFGFRASREFQPNSRLLVQRRRSSVSGLQIGGFPQQVVILLEYADHQRRRLAAARGFMVNHT